VPLGVVGQPTTAVAIDAGQRHLHGDRRVAAEASAVAQPGAPTEPHRNATRCVVGPNSGRQANGLGRPWPATVLRNSRRVGGAGELRASVDDDRRW
jgi:hypothetical protein